MDSTMLTYSLVVLKKFIIKGHVGIIIFISKGDGNFHLIILVYLIIIKIKDEKELKTAEDANHRLVLRALDFEGTCSGGKLDF
jgi:FAD/FMN-containing dehydrogenase